VHDKFPFSVQKKTILPDCPPLGGRSKFGAGSPEGEEQIQQEAKGSKGVEKQSPPFRGGLGWGRLQGETF